MLDVDAPWFAFRMQKRAESLFKICQIENLPAEVVLDSLRSFQAPVAAYDSIIKMFNSILFYTAVWSSNAPLPIAPGARAYKEYPKMIPVIRDAEIQSRGCDEEGTRAHFDGSFDGLNISYIYSCSLCWCCFTCFCTVRDTANHLYHIQHTDTDHAQPKFWPLESPSKANIKEKASQIQARYQTV